MIDNSPALAVVTDQRSPAVQAVPAAVPDDVPDGSLSVDQLGSRIIGLAGRLASAMCRWLLLVADFDARDGAAKFCLPTTARWLGHYCGLSRRTAIEHVRVARTLAAFPALAVAMTAGRLSYSHARAITRIAECGDTALVESLVMVAEHGTVGQLEDTVRGLRTVHDNETSADENAAPAETVTHRWRADSRFGLSANLDPEHGALLLSALDAVARREGITQPEALARMAEIALATLNAADTPAPSLRGDEYAAVVVHLDAAAVPAEGDGADADADADADSNPQPQLEKGSAERTPRRRPFGRIARGSGLADAAVTRLLCSGRIRALVTDRASGRYTWRSGVLDVGANRRLVSDKQFRALLHRDDGGCAVPGCGSRNGLEAHHVKHWIYGGKTVMANLILACRAHHRAVHEGELQIRTSGDEQFRFYRADGCELPSRGDPSRISGSARPIEDEHAHVHPAAPTTRWDGTRLDRHYAVAVLAPGLRAVSDRRVS